MKELIVNSVHSFGNGFALEVRNGNEEISVGDIIGGEPVVRIEAYGKIMEILPKNWTGGIWFDRMPLIKIFG